MAIKRHKKRASGKSAIPAIMLVAIICLVCAQTFHHHFDLEKPHEICTICANPGDFSHGYADLVGELNEPLVEYHSLKVPTFFYQAYFFNTPLSRAPPA